jgi:hypothetical protein
MYLAALANGFAIGGVKRRRNRAKQTICAELPNGGDHTSRKYIAEQLIQAARGGKTTLGALTYVRRRALVHLRSKLKSA